MEIFLYLIIIGICGAVFGVWNYTQSYENKIDWNRYGHQGKIDKPPGKPPTGGSAVKKPV